MEYIYTLTNTITGSVYVGKTNNPERRHYHHMNLLERGQSHHPKLQEDFNRYGDVYEFATVDKQLESDTIDRESLWINKIDPKKRLNIQKIEGNAFRAHNRIKAIRAGLG